MNQSEFNNKVQQKLDDKKVKDYVDDLETQPTELPINIPSNPFMASDVSDGIERDELTTKQMMLMVDYLKRKGWSFNDWWKKEGSEEINSVYSETIIRNKVITEDGSLLDWWNKYLRNNLNKIIDKLRFMQVWGDSLK